MVALSAQSLTVGSPEIGTPQLVIPEPSFPESPTAGQQFEYAGLIYTWVGNRWSLDPWRAQIAAEKEARLVVIETDIDAVENRADDLEAINADSRLDTLEAINAETRISALEDALALLVTIQPGDVIITFDETIRSGFVELAGQTITGGATANPGVSARYPWMVSGSDLVLPDGRGKFLRSWAHGSGNDPDRASRTARPGGQGGDYPGTGQGHALKDHYHEYNEGYNPGTYTAPTTGGGGFFWSNFTADTGGVADIPSDVSANESRSINLAVTFQMRLG